MTLCATSASRVRTRGPLLAGERVLDVAVLLALDPVGPRLVEDPDEAEAGLLHDPSRGDVHRHGRGVDAARAQVPKAFRAVPGPLVARPRPQADANSR